MKPKLTASEKIATMYFVAKQSRVKGSRGVYFHTLMGAMNYADSIGSVCVFLPTDISKGTYVTKRNGVWNEEPLIVGS